MKTRQGGARGEGGWRLRFIFTTHSLEFLVPIANMLVWLSGGLIRQLGEEKGAQRFETKSESFVFVTIIHYSFLCLISLA